jgi:DNA-binding NarL/FixJ family response regulator
METMDSAPLKVLIADDHPLLLAGVRRVLERSESIEVVGEARSAGEVMSLIERRQPQLVLLDLRMPGSSGVDCIERIRGDWPDIKVVVLSANDDRGSIDGALGAGASAYIVKSVDAMDIASVLRQTACGNVFHPVAGRQCALEPADEPVAPALTDRERTILDAVASGMTTAAISKDLWVSEHTVKFHLTNIYRKLGVSNRAGAVRYALENGVLAA